MTKATTKDGDERHSVAGIARWGLRLAYLLAPSVTVIGMVATSQRLLLPNNLIDPTTWAVLNLIVPVGVTVLLTLLLMQHFDDVAYLFLGAPLSFALLVAAFILAPEIGIVQVGMCEGTAFVLFVVIPAISVVSLFGFLMGLVRVISGFCSMLKAARRPQHSETSGQMT